MKRSPALQPLSHDHHQGLVLVGRLRRALRSGEATAPLAETVGAFWRENLLCHFAEEEALVLPALLDGAPALADRMVREHVEIGALVRAVTDAPDGEPPLAAFADALAAHIRFEEREAFPAAERVAAAVPQG